MNAFGQNLSRCWLHLPHSCQFTESSLEPWEGARARLMIWSAGLISSCMSQSGRGGRLSVDDFVARTFGSLEGNRTRATAFAYQLLPWKITTVAPSLRHATRSFFLEVAFCTQTRSRGMAATEPTLGGRLH